MRNLSALIILILLISGSVAPQSQVGGTSKLGGTTKIGVSTALSFTALITTSPVTASPRSDVTGCVGFKFTANSAITVQQLGRWVISGNSGTHVVHLFDTVTSSDVATATVDTSGGPAGAYKYATVSSPPTLVSGRSYVVASAETNGGDQWYNQESYTLTSAGTLGKAVFSTDGSCTAYSDGADGQSYVPPNLKY
jgi:hypothetical protein